MSGSSKNSDVQSDRIDGQRQTSAQWCPVVSRRALMAAATSAAFVLGGVPSLRATAQTAMPTRRIPITGEALPIIGLGSSKVVEQIAADGADPLRDVLATLVEHGGSVVDSWPRNAENDAAFGGVIGSPSLRDRLFVTSKIDRMGADAGAAQFHETRRLYGRETLDLIQIFSLTDLATHWPQLGEWKREGLARYVGVTVAEPRLHAQLEDFLRRESPDFVQINYSITEREAEERLLPLAAERGAAVLINRPFMNGAYFRRLEDVPLPEWTRDFDCTSWAQFSLKYILANPAVTCVLTETSNPEHMQENASTAFGPLPDEAQRQRMRELIATV